MKELNKEKKKKDPIKTGEERRQKQRQRGREKQSFGVWFLIRMVFNNSGKLETPLSFEFGNLEK